MFRKLALVSFTSLVAACASTGNYDDSGRAPAEVEDRIIIDGEVLPLPEEPRIAVESLPETERVSPVVQRLLASAEQQRSQGDTDGAANSLERALRIEPRNAVLWSRLANVRYTQNDWQQAVQLAAKSNTLAASNHQLRRQNWYLMASAYSAMGDELSAQKYRDKLNQ
ncbi:MAG: tetratricopeptide repeat protein [Pseudomonadota bacterium]